MPFFLANPANQAHLNDLRDRLVAQLRREPSGLSTDYLLIEKLVAVVSAMDNGAVPTRDALAAFQSSGVPGFNFGKWLIEMLDEGVYLDSILDEAA